MRVIRVDSSPMAANGCTSNARLCTQLVNWQNTQSLPFLDLVSITGGPLQWNLYMCRLLPEELLFFQDQGIKKGEDITT